MKARAKNGENKMAKKIRHTNKQPWRHPREPASKPCGRTVLKGGSGSTGSYGRWSGAFFCDDKLSNTATRIEEHLTGLRLRNGVLEEIKKPCTSVAPDLKEAMVARKKQLYNRRIEKKRATTNFLQRSASLNYQKSEFMALFHKQNSPGKNP